MNEIEIGDEEEDSGNSSSSSSNEEEEDEVATDWGRFIFVITDFEQNQSKLN